MPLNERSSLMVAAAIVALAGVFWWSSRPAPARIDGAGWAPEMTFAATNVVWTELWGHHAVSLELSLVSGAGRFRINVADYAAICAQVLAAMPEAPAGIAAAQVYRVNLIKVAATRVGAPIPVVDGTCTVAAGTQVLRPTYPAPLQNWELDTYVVAVEDGKEGVTFRLRQRADALAALNDPPFEKACEAIISERILEERNLKSYLEGKWVRVEFVSEIGNWLLGFSTRSSRLYNVVAGKCFASESGQDT